MQSTMTQAQYTEPAKEKKKDKGPKFYTSPTGIKVLNYRVYYMSFFEKLLTIIVAFGAGAFVGYLFFGNLAMDEFGQATNMTRILNLLIPGLAGLGLVIVALPARKKALQRKRVEDLAKQFRDLLEGLTTSIGAGSNVTQAFRAVYSDMQVQYDSEAYIIKELEVILSGIANNIAIEDLLKDLAERSDNEDIQSFADVFAVCFRKGGNIGKVILNTHAVLSQKMQIKEEIQTTIASSRNSLNIMLVMPVALVGIIKGMGDDMATNFATTAGVIASIIGCICFVVAYIVGQKIMVVKV